MSEFEAIKALLLRGYAVEMFGIIGIRPTDQGVICLDVNETERTFPDAGINDAILTFLAERKALQIGPEFEGGSSLNTPE